MSQGRRLAAKDYKHGGRGAGGGAGGFDLGQYRQFGYGLGLGLLVALGVFVHQQRTRPAATGAQVEAAPQPRATQADDGTPARGDEDPAEQFDFYDMLPKYEVVVSEQERDVRRDTPAVKVEQPGVYVLQVGSYRNLPDAERLRLKLSKQGIDASIQRVAVDTDVWHRVRIGPLRDLARLNTIRRELRASDIDALLIRLGD